MRIRYNSQPKRTYSSKPKAQSSIIERPLEENKRKRGEYLPPFQKIFLCRRIAGLDDFLSFPSVCTKSPPLFSFSTCSDSFVSFIAIASAFYPCTCVYPSIQTERARHFAPTGCILFFSLHSQTCSTPVIWFRAGISKTRSIWPSSSFALPFFIPQNVYNPSSPSPTLFPHHPLSPRKRHFPLPLGAGAPINIS